LSCTLSVKHQMTEANTHSESTTCELCNLKIEKRMQSISRASAQVFHHRSCYKYVTEEAVTTNTKDFSTYK
jgi:ribosome-binding protein aMBF1 (putative translation factor)